MPRIRTIKPEFWDSPGTAKASPLARLLYIAMWNWADDYGIGDANPRKLMSFAFPNDDDLSASEFPSLSKEVADCYNVIFYEVGGRPYYCIPSWEKHQRTERKAQRTNPPPPDDVSAGHDTYVETSEAKQGKSDTSHGNSDEGTGEQGNRGTGEQPPCSPPLGDAAPKRASHGSRIPSDFAVTDAMRTYAAEKAPNVDIDAETEHFVDYWTAKAGQAARKADWQATWRTWMRRAQERQGQRNGARAGPKPSKDDKVRALQNMKTPPLQAIEGGWR